MAVPPYHGLLVVDKPGGMTSRDVVDRAVTWFPRGTRLGHTGTLDPLATGVLVLGVGAATRLTEYVQGMAKTYRAGLLLGARSDTDDADGLVQAVACPGPLPDRAAVVACLQEFTGTIDQVPPAFSAAKVTGRRAYHLARRGEEVALEPRRVRVDRIDLLAYEYPRLEIQVHCGKGTYIRSLARDLGNRLGCGALVETLRRTRVGPFEAAGALSLGAEAAFARSRLLPLSAAVAELPRVTVELGDVARLRRGQKVLLPGALSPTTLSAGEEVAVLDTVGQLVAVGGVDFDKRLLAPLKVLPPRESGREG
jgi:tRNA pseudouridine55 synthase